MLLKRLFGRRAESMDTDAQQIPVERALESPEVAVRRQACRQLTDLRLLRDRAEHDSDAGVRELAEARYRRLLCGLDSQAPSLEARLAELQQPIAATIIGQAALHGSEPQLRLSAIGRLDDAELLASCAINDLVAANRLAAAERITHRAALERVVKTIGKRDKRVYRFARERLRQILEQEERPRRAHELGEALCERLERLGRYDNWVQDRAVLEHLEQQWQALQDDADLALRQRYQQLRQRFLDDYEAYREAHAAQIADQEAQAAAAREREALLDALRDLSARASRLDLRTLEQEQQRLREAWQATGEPSPGRAPALDQTYRQLNETLQGARRELQERTRATRAAEQLLAELHQLDEHGGAPERQRLEALRKRRRALPEALAQTQAEASPEAGADSSTSTPTSAPAADPTADPAGTDPAPKMAPEMAPETASQTPPTQASAVQASATQASGAAEQDAKRQRSPLEAIDRLLARLEQRAQRHQRQLMRKLEALPERLDELEAHLNQGELRKADPLYQSLSATLEHARSAAVGREILSVIDRRLKQIAPQLRELRHWRRWSTDEHRAQLCAQVESLAADHEHPPEPSINRLQELKEQWQALDHQGAPADDALWERFRIAAEQIRERARPFLEAQTALRSENRKQREALAKRLDDFLEKVDWERVDWKKLNRAEREMRQAWRTLVESPGGDAQGTKDRAIEGRFRRALRRLDRALAEERERNQAEKHQLLEQMRALAEEPDLRRAIDAAKQLQQQWQTTVPARHRDENQLWQQFRAASDRVFARRAAEQEAKGASLRENLHTREQICRELLELTEAAADSPETLSTGISALKTRWQDTESLPIPRQAQTTLNRQWRESLAAARARLSELREAERWSGLERLAQRADYCDQAARALISASEAGESATEALERGWRELPALDDADLTEALEQRFASLLASRDDPGAHTALARLMQQNRERRESLCLSLEIVAQVQSPAALKAERMQRQVERLRDHMGDGMVETEADLSALLRDWYLACPASASEALEARLERVRSALRDGDTSPPPAAHAVG
jgi:ribosome-associated translation inhibitor RaiA